MGAGGGTGAVGHMGPKGTTGPEEVLSDIPYQLKCWMQFKMKQLYPTNHRYNNSVTTAIKTYYVLIIFILYFSPNSLFHGKWGLLFSVVISSILMFECYTLIKLQMTFTGSGAISICFHVVEGESWASNLGACHGAHNQTLSLEKNEIFYTSVKLKVSHSRTWSIRLTLTQKIKFWYNSSLLLSPTQ